MVRPQGKPRKIGNVKDEQMREAINLVINENYSIRKAAKEKQLKFQTLFRYIKKFKANPDKNIKMEPNYAVRRVFTDDQEKELAKYLITCSKMSYGLSTIALRCLAFEMANRNSITVPNNWIKSKSAGLEWMRGFLFRHKSLSIRQPEACSLTRLTSFNPHNINLFFDNLSRIYKDIPSLGNGCRVYNLDETGTTTVQKPKKIIAEKGIKQVNQCTSGERGVLVTTCVIISASGSFIAPAMVFPRKYFKQHMTNGAPPGTLGLANLSGWMNSELFPLVLKHFIKCSNSTKENPSLLIFDNHESHISVEVIDIAKDAGVTLLTLPPHSSHKLQPLDVSVFGPFKCYYNSAVDSWMMRNPGKPMSIYEVAQCVGEAHIKALTPSNIMTGFKKTGIFPFDRNIFSEYDFLSSAVTDRPEPQANTQQIPCSSDSLQQTEVLSPSVSITSSNADFISPEKFIGYPKAAPRKIGQAGRKRGRSTILTDTPEKLQLLMNKEKSSENSKGKNKYQIKNLFRDKKHSKETLTSSDEDDSQIVFNNSDDDDDLESLAVDPNNFEDLERDPVEDEYVLVEFNKKVFYVAKVIKAKDENGCLEVSYLRKSDKMSGSFIMPAVPDESVVDEKDIKLLLPMPIVVKSKRLSGYIRFPLDFQHLDVR